MNNTIILENCVTGFKKTNEIEHLEDTEAFEIFSLLQITKDYDLTYSEIEDSLVDGGQDGGIDSVIILINQQYISGLEELEEFNFNENVHVHVIICQSKYETSFGESVIDKLYISIPEILNLELDDDALLRRFNPKLVEKIVLLRKAWLDCVSKGGNLSISFEYACKANEVSVNASFIGKKKQLIELVKMKTNQKQIVFEEFSAKEIMEAYQRPKSSTIELKFKENPIPVPFSDEEYGYIGVVSLSDYYKFIVTENGKINEQIFESNVRHFQGNIDVNKKIQDTLSVDFQRDFWWLNNGISIIASDCKLVPKALFLSNVQIVNGLQTSFLIGNHYDANNEKDSRSLLVKVVISNDKETIDKIICASNSQTPVSPSVLRATDEIQRNIELFFAGLGYWYDRRKNYYKNLGKPARKIFSIQGTAQAIEAILYRNPSTARSTPTGIVKANKSYERIFNPDLNFKTYLNCCLIYRCVSGFIKSSLDSEEKNKARNFAYHTCRVLASIFTDKAEYQSNDISSLDLEGNEKEVNVVSAYGLLNVILSQYQAENPEENIINIAKSKKFTSILNEEIALKFNS